MVLAAEQEAYDRHLPDSLKHDDSKFVLTKGDEVQGFCDTDEDALQARYQAFDLQPFMVKKVSSYEQFQCITRI